MPSFSEVLPLPAPEGGGEGVPSSAEQHEHTKEQSPPPPPPPPVSVATHTKTIGMIHPPPDIRNIVDKTAQFVARNGPEFEKRILANGRNSVKFNFLNPTDPYHAYYQHRVSEFKAQAQASPAQTPDSLPMAPPGTTAELSTVPFTKDATEPIKFELPKRVPENLVEPEAEHYTVKLPEGITGMELDVIKLTAQFAARNGTNFLQGLLQREFQNPTFAFLKQSHSMYPFFTSLADTYSKVLMPKKGLVDKLKKENLDRTTVLERCLHRLEWEKSQERQRQQQEDELEHERMQMALIDWHDFVVVETIEFADDEDEELPKPMTLEDVIRRSKASVDDDEQIVDAGKDMEVDMDEEEVQLVEDSMRATSLEEGGDKGEEPAVADVPLVDDNEPPMRIVRNWKRPEERFPAEKDPTKFVLSPITGELIPVNEMAEHMRISLIDPKYKEQKERMMAKLRETTLATDDEISRNIVGLARTRPDIFGTTEEEVSNAVKAEIEKKKEEPKQVIWDGHSGSISRTANQAMAQTVNIDELDTLTAASLPGPMAPPRLAPPPVRPLPPPPGLALNLPRLPQTSGISTMPPPPLPRPTITVTPPSRPQIVPSTLSSVPTLVGHPQPAPPSMASSVMGAAQPGIQHVAQFSALQPPPRPSYPQSMPPPSMSMMPPPPLPRAMPPPPPPDEVPPPPPDEPELKRQKLDEMLIPEDQFLAQHPGAVRLLVAIPLVEGEGNLKGQMLEVTIHSLSETILSLKEKISGEIALPSNKQKLSGRGGFFFKDNLSLAYYNVGPGETLTLALRERGGRKR